MLLTDRELAGRVFKTILDLIPERGFAQGALARRLFRLGPKVIARELDVWLPPEVLADAGDAAPLRYVAGKIDLVYRDPSDDAWVVADYKTDRFDESEPDAIADRAASYAEQGRVYVEAVARALAIDPPPRFELWMLSLDRIITTPPIS